MIDTNDPYITQEQLEQRLRSLPLYQNVPHEATFHIRVENNTHSYTVITTDDIIINPNSVKGNKNIKLFPCKFDISAIIAGSYLNLDNIKVVAAPAMNIRNGMHISAVNVAVVELDEIDDTRAAKFYGNYMLSYKTSGTEDAKDLLMRTIEDIRSYLERIDIDKVIASILDKNQYHEAYFEEIEIHIAMIIRDFILASHTGSRATVYEDSIIRTSILRFSGVSGNDHGVMLRKIISLSQKYYVDLLSKIKNM